MSSYTIYLLRSFPHLFQVNNPHLNAVIITTKSASKKDDKNLTEKLPLNEQGKTKSIYNQMSVPDADRDPPEGYNRKEFVNKSFSPPEYLDLKIFRPLGAEEVLGPCAHKQSIYKNPEYYSYHRYSYMDIFMEVLKLRECGPTHCVKCTDQEKADNNSGICEESSAKEESVQAYNTENQRNNEKICNQEEEKDKKK